MTKDHSSIMLALLAHLWESLVDIYWTWRQFLYNIWNSEQKHACRDRCREGIVLFFKNRIRIFTFADKEEDEGQKLPKLYATQLITPSHIYDEFRCLC